MARGAEFVQLGDRILNRQHIIALTSLGRRRTTVHTLTGEHAVDVPLATAAGALAVEYKAVAK